MIVLPLIKVTDSFFQISFLYVLIDYDPTVMPLTTGISIKIDSIEDQLVFDTSITGTNICGFSGYEYVGVYTITLPTSKLKNLLFKVSINN